MGRLGLSAANNETCKISDLDKQRHGETMEGR